MFVVSFLNGNAVCFCEGCVWAAILVNALHFGVTVFILFEGNEIPLLIDGLNVFAAILCLLFVCEGAFGVDLVSVGHFLIFVLLSITLLCAHAQEENSKLTISGRLTDVDSKEPMEMATIQLFWANDTSFVGGTLSNEKGNFSLEAPSNGTYRLRISLIGYQTLERDVILRNDRNQDLGELRMTPDVILLKEAVVTGRAAQIVVKKDTLLYNPEAFRTPEGSALEELIKRIPGAEIDEEGNITVNGKAVKKILLDGKEFMLGDIETALKNIPVSIIQNVKFYDQQSDQARITGIEDGNKETVLDFTVPRHGQQLHRQHTPRNHGQRQQQGGERRMVEPSRSEYTEDARHQLQLR